MALELCCIPVPCEPVGTVTAIRAGFVDTNTAVLAGRSLRTLVNVLVASLAHETRGALASVGTVDHIGFADR